MDPRRCARQANAARDFFMATGQVESLVEAEAFYGAAIRGAIRDKDPLLQAWIMCNRINLLLHEVRNESNIYSLNDLDIALGEAMAVIDSVRTLRDRKFKRETSDWLTQRYLEFSPKRVARLAAPALRLAAGTAIEEAAGQAPELGPEAA